MNTTECNYVKYFGGDIFLSVILAVFMWLWVRATWKDSLHAGTLTHSHTPTHSLATSATHFRQWSSKEVVWCCPELRRECLQTYSSPRKATSTRNCYRFSLTWWALWLSLAGCTGEPNGPTETPLDLNDLIKLCEIIVVDFSVHQVCEPERQTLEIYSSTDKTNPHYSIVKCVNIIFV